MTPPPPVHTAGSAGQQALDWTACHECDLLHAPGRLPVNGRAVCRRCGATLRRAVPNSRERALALNLTALMLFGIANAYPFISLKLSGRIEENALVSGALELWRTGMAEVGALVLLTGVVFPLVTIAGTLYVLLAPPTGRHTWKAHAVFRLVRTLRPWSLLGVFMLGVLIAIVKLLDLATVIPGVSLWAFAALVVVAAAATANLDEAVIWPPMRSAAPRPGTGGSAAGQGLDLCHTCNLLVARSGAVAPHRRGCPRCGSPLHRRKPNSLARTQALVVSAVLLLIPANIYPVMTVIRFGRGFPDTILSGVIHLIEGGMWPLAMIVFFASIVVPVLKLLVLSFLLVTVHRRSGWRPKDRTRLYRVTETVGAWSMVDIYLLAVLVALVNLDALATIRPGIGASFFAAVVIITMLAAHSFDPRLIWDNTGTNAVQAP